MEEVQKHLYVLILAGGGGTRLWPQSRENSPKQFIGLIEGQSLYDLSIERSLKITKPSNVFVITNRKNRNDVLARSKRIPPANLIFEPIRRDTALAYAIGAAYILVQDPEAVIVNLHADNLITPLSAFVREAQMAAKVAFESRKLVTIGIKPRYPHTGMGHIHIKSALKDYPNTFIGDKFVEKPNLVLAKKYTASPKYYWNSGMYVWKAQVLLDLLSKHAAKTIAFFPKFEKAIGTSVENQTLQQIYQMAPTISIDYALSEKLHSFLCYVGDFHWTDVGDWQEVWKSSPKDSLGNVIEGPRGRGQLIGVDSKDNLFFLDKKLVATVGLSDMIVVDTPDALLICPKNDSQAVKKVVEILKEKKLIEYL